MLAFLPHVGLPELVIILILALLIFGNRLPEVMRSLGRSVNEFKKGVGELSQDDDSHPSREEAKPEKEGSKKDVAQASTPTSEDTQKKA